MFARPEFLWLTRRFREYDLVYLDPLVCHQSLRQSGSSRWAFSRTQAHSAEDLLSQLRGILGIASEDASPSSFLEDTGVGTMLKRDRPVQRFIATIINRHLSTMSAIDGRYCNGIRTLHEQRSSLDSVADRLHSDSLILVDAMLAMGTGVPADIRKAAQAAVQYEGDPRRSMECMLTDIPAPLLTLCDPSIGMMVDRHSFYNYSEPLNTVISAGWYPFTRTLGLYATSPGKPAFINVIAILIRRFPSLDELLVSLPGEPKRCSLPGMLEHVRIKWLEPEIEAVEARASGAATRRKTKKAKKKRKGKKSHQATNASAGTIPAGSKRCYEKDELFLSPLHLFQICCQLSGASWQGLEARATPAYQVLNRYVECLEVLGKHLRDLGVPTQIGADRIDSRDRSREASP